MNNSGSFIADDLPMPRHARHLFLITVDGRTVGEYGDMPFKPSASCACAVGTNTPYSHGLPLAGTGRTGLLDNDSSGRFVLNQFRDPLVQRHAFCFGCDAGSVMGLGVEEAKGDVFEFIFQTVSLGYRYRIKLAISVYQFIIP